MTMFTNHYDIIIIGTGAGGGTLAHRFAPTRKKILGSERGDFLPREKANWRALEVYQKERYHIDEQWIGNDGESFRPQTGYWVSGNTKLYGAALIRLRERDFTKVTHKNGISPAWELTYQDFELYYAQAEKLYDVHSDRLIHRWTSVLKTMSHRAMDVIPFSIYPRSHVPVQAVAH